MLHTKRFDRAIKKLYLAFHNHTLNPECCYQCAVGNILDQNDAWKHLSDEHGSLRLNYVGQVHQALGKRFNGYTPIELLQIEIAFLKGCGYKLPLRKTYHKTNKIDQDVLFEGLCLVVNCLCQLDGCQNLIDLSALWQYKPKKEIVIP